MTESAIIQPRKIKPCSNATIVDSDCDVGFNFRPELGLFVSVHLCIKRCAECFAVINSDFSNLIEKLLRREKVTIEMAYHDINSLDWLYSQGRVLRPSKLRFGNSSMGTNMFDGICIAALKIFKDILCSRITRLQIINMSKTDKNQFHDIKLIELEL